MLLCDVRYDSCCSCWGVFGWPITVKAAAPAAVASKAPKAAAPAKPVAPHVAKPMGPGVRMEKLANMKELPSKYKRKPLTAEEQEHIDVSLDSESLS